MSSLPADREGGPADTGLPEEEVMGGGGDRSVWVLLLIFFFFFSVRGVR